jgi:hypothetical protein
MMLRAASGVINSKWHFPSQQKIQGFLFCFPAGRKALVTTGLDICARDRGSYECGQG